jgi:hypothetical protein
MERAKRYGLAALMAFLALNIWTGAPLLALWIGSRVQGSESQASMTAVVAVVACLAGFSIALYQALKYVMHAYQEATGTLPTVRTHAPWLQSLSGERPSYSAARISGAERVIVVTVVIAALVFEVWFFFFSGSPIG